MAPRVAERANCAPGCAAVTLFLVAHFEHKAARCVIFVAFVNYERFCVSQIISCGFHWARAASRSLDRNQTL
jgi:hypothetical protein